MPSPCFLPLYRRTKSTAHFRRTLSSRMNESWRMRMGMPRVSPRQSTDHSSFVFAGAETLHADDFSDVFGGPPRSVLSRRFSGRFELKQSDIFYDEVFQPPEFVSHVTNGGRNLPSFRIPAKEAAFYSDVFGSDYESRSRERSVQNSRSKSNSSSILGSDPSPIRSTIGDDVAFSACASKLRPMNVVPCGWNSPPMMHGEPQRKQDRPAFPCNRSAYNENRFPGYDFTESFISPNYGFTRHFSSPETISLDRPNSYQSNKVSGDDVEVNSARSFAASSLCQVPEDNKAAMQGNVMSEEDEDEDEVMSSYVIEINSDYRVETPERGAVDEAIAWAKEMFQRKTCETNLSSELRDNEQCVEVEGSSNSCELAEQQLNESGVSQVSQEEKQRSRTCEERKQELENDKIMERLDEDIKLWSGGRETNIILLLSTLHQILWPNSGWHAISITSLIGTSQVKKAYQKARLCLHPDKLQQRGATEPQKYVAEKAFSILQDAWTAFISQDVF